ncbi:SAM-dependent methyltransferase [Paenibacillus selenitireducens]|uniref:SAM-dependent methyltransferase n=1 Tax=Paenibacillus selenitireducens TaxID=1324314 RepID=A0A1T2XAK6_9BACL|nr:class I SAM-dependent methyltransferase [Paenibacillus selenitireducens]OPA76842.1 SAM-dependent methyltransferase [Paenibacillus selenitireducens]
MGFLSVLSYAQKLVAERAQPGDIVVDATVGTGVDTLFLAKAVGAKGTVFGFDIQPLALELARERLNAAAPSAAGAVVAAGLTDARLLLRSHAELAAALPATVHGHVAAVMFNLGYLPVAEIDASARVITLAETTLPALDAALDVLRPGGIITIVVYPGHEGGETEGDAVEAWATKLSAIRGQAVIYRMLQRPQAPYVIAVEKR